MKNVDENSAHQKTFESFDAGNRNQAAVHIAQEFCLQDKSDLVNPLFIFGESGSGKTHLLLAMKDKLEHENPDMIVEYAIGSELIGSLIDAYCSLSKRSKSHSGNDDRKNPFDELQAVDVLLIDDVEPRQFGSNAALDILQQIASSYACKGGRIAVASSYSPTDFCFDSDSNPLRFQNKSSFAVCVNEAALASHPVSATV